MPVLARAAAFCWATLKAFTALGSARAASLLGEHLAVRHGHLAEGRVGHGHLLLVEFVASAAAGQLEGHGGLAVDQGFLAADFLLLRRAVVGDQVHGHLAEVHLSPDAARTSTL